MDAFHFTPGQYGDPFDPSVDQWHIHLNGLDFSSTAGNTLSFTNDNFKAAVIPEPSACALLLGGMCALSDYAAGRVGLMGGLLQAANN